MAKKDTGRGKTLETAHSCAGAALGQLALMVETKKLSRTTLEEIRDDLREAARLIEVAIS